MGKCWANNLGNCDGKITGEHIVSNSIQNKTVRIKGFPWCKNEPKEIGSSSLINNILCEKHNSELSIFDSEAKNFISVIDDFCKRNNDFTRFGFRKKDLPIIHIINGRKFERWCCKTLINITLSQKNNILIALEKITPIIYKDENFKKPYGLNFAISVGQKIDTKNFLEVSPLLNIKENSEKELAGGLFTFRGFRLILLIPCSKQNVIINKKLELNLSKEIKENWINLQLNWHNKNIDYLQPGKQVLMQRIKFKW